jgi:hypothetical protein
MHGIGGNMSEYRPTEWQPIDTDELAEATHIIQEITLSPDYRPTDLPARRLNDNKDVVEICLAVGELLERLKSETVNVPGIGKVYIIPPEWVLYYAPAYPKDLVKLTGGPRTQESPQESPANVITWKVVKREAGSISEQPFSGKQPANPRLRGDVPTEVSGEYLEVYSKWMDNLIQFDCFALDGKDAELLAINLENTLYAYSNIFKAMGAQRWLHWGRASGSDYEQSIYNAIGSDSGLNFRSFYYYVRTELFWVTPTIAIERIINDVLVKFGRKQ